MTRWHRSALALAAMPWVAVACGGLIADEATPGTGTTRSDGGAFAVDGGADTSADASDTTDGFHANVPPFAPGVRYVAGSGARAIATARMDNDAFLDLIVASSVANTVSILHGRGDGTFLPSPDSLFVDSYPSSLAVLDLGNGRADIAVGQGNASNVGVAMQQAGGGFPASTLYAVEPAAYARAVKGVRLHSGAAAPDLVAAVPGGLAVLTNDGSGTFAVTTIDNGFLGTQVIAALASGDFDRDMHQDLLVIDQQANQELVFLHGNGDGTFRAPTGTDAFPAGASGAIAVADFNEDGKLDCIVVGAGDNQAYLRLGNGDGTFGPQVGYALKQMAGAAIAIADFNGDGHLDFVVADFGGHLSVFLSTAPGVFRAAVDVSAGMTPMDLTTGDFNGDGKPDIAMADQGVSGVIVLINQM